jgi:hypothetical protein
MKVNLIQDKIIPGPQQPSLVSGHILDVYDHFYNTSVPGPTKKVHTGAF